jgi:hypothetical protein
LQRFQLFISIFSFFHPASRVVTGAPCRAAAAFPIMTASRRTMCNILAIFASNGEAFILSAHLFIKIDKKKAHFKVTVQYSFALFVNNKLQNINTGSCLD